MGSEEIVLFLAVAVLIGSALVFLTQETHKAAPVPYSVTLLVTGVVLELLSPFLGPIGDSVTEISMISPHTLLLVFLPALIFESALVTNFHIIWREKEQALLLATFGVFISAVLTSLIPMFIFDYPEWTWDVALMFGFILAATDPIAVVAVIRDLGASPRLATLIEAESMLNDGTAFVAFQLFQERALGTSHSTSYTLGFFMQLSIGGVLWGVTMGLLAAFWLHKVSHNAVLETSITVLFAYSTFWIAELGFSFTVSGVLAVVGLGITMARYKTVLSTVEVYHTWELITFLANTAIFTLAGIIVSDRVFLPDFDFAELGYLFVLYILLNLIRLLMVFILFPILSITGYGMDSRSALVVSFSGLRGAVSLSLALLTESLEEDGDITANIQSQIVFHVAGIVLLTLLVNGTLAPFVVHALNLDAISPGSKLILENTLKHVDNKVTLLFRSLKNDRHFSDANWPQVYADVPMHTEDNATLLEMDDLRRSEDSMLCDPKVLECELRHRVLTVMQGSYKSQYAEGLMSRGVLDLLLESVGFGLDQDDLGAQWRSIELNFRIPRIMHRLYSVYILSYPCALMIYHKLAFAVELTQAYLTSCEVVSRVLGGLPEWVEEDTLQNVRAELSEYSSKAIAEYKEVQISYPDIYTQIQTRHATEYLLIHQRHMFEKLARSGVLEDKEVIKRIQLLDSRRSNVRTRTLVSMSRHSIEGFILDLSFLQHISRLDQEYVLSRSQLTLYESGDCILDTGCYSQGLFVLTRGKVHMFCDASIVDTLVPGSVFGLWSSLSNSPSSIRYIASSYAEVFRIPQLVIQELVGRDSAIEAQLWRLAAGYIVRYRFIHQFEVYRPIQLSHILNDARYERYTDPGDVILERVSILLTGAVKHKDFEFDAPALLQPSKSFYRVGKGSRLLILDLDSTPTGPMDKYVSHYDDKELEQWKKHALDQHQNPRHSFDLVEEITVDIPGSSSVLPTRNTQQNGTIVLVWLAMEDVEPNQLRYTPVKGNYTVQVHIIEGRELKGRGSGDSSDPTVNVTCFGMRKSTSIKKKQFNPRWDEVLYFEIDDMDPQQLEAEHIRLTVNDANTVRRDVQIGAYDLDMGFVYYKRDHEIYRQWIGLSDTRGENQGVQGYLKVSVVVLGPNDEQKSHDKDAIDPSDEGTLLLAPYVEQTGYILDLFVYEAVELPEMDRTLKKLKCDPYVLLDFAGRQAKTSILAGQNVTFNEVLHFPVIEPLMSDVVKVQLYDYDLGSADDLIGTVFLSYKELRAHPLAPRWFNMYGGPEFCDSDVAMEMNNGITEGTNYRGRVLIEASVRQVNKPKISIEKIEDLKLSYLPQMSNWILQVDVYQANEIPLKGKWRCEVCCGNSSFTGHEVLLEDGLVKWFSAIMTNDNSSTDLPLKLPSDPNFCPDLFIYLTRGDKRISFFRVPFQEVVNAGWVVAPRWICMKEDKVLDRLSDEQFPGNLLIGVRAGLLENLPKDVHPNARPLLAVGGHRDESLMSFGNLAITLKCGRGLPATDISTNACDPFVILRLGETSVTSKTIRRECNPSWNEEFLFNGIELSNTTLVIEVWDWDLIGRNSKMCEVSFPCAGISDSPGVDFNVSKWFALGNNDARINLGFDFKSTEAPETVVSENRLRGRRSASSSRTGRSVSRSKQIFSRRRATTLEDKGPEYFGEPIESQYIFRAHIFQARRLAAMDLSGASDPFVECRCDGVSARTSIKANTLNPNWYETLDLTVEIPSLLSMAPPIHCLVYDADMAGGVMYAKELLGRLEVSAVDAAAMNSSTGIAEPRWFSLTNVDGDPVDGQILVSFHLVPVGATPPPRIQLRPPTIPMWLEISTLGLRSLQSTFGINKASVSFKLPSGKQFGTVGSRIPTATDPNLMQVLTVPVDMPEDPRFAPTLDIEVVDTRLGGYLNTTIGTSYIHLEDFLSNDVFVEEKAVVEEVEYETSLPPRPLVSLNQKPADGNDTDESVATDSYEEPATKTPFYPGFVDPFSVVKTSEYDDLSDEEFDVLVDSGDAAERALLDEFQTVEWGETAVGTSIPDYMVGRDIVDSNLEATMELSPFNEIPIFSGKEFPRKFESPRRNVGSLKALVRLSMDQHPPGGINISELISPSDLYVRVYILKGAGLTPMDRSGKSDPYLKVKLGKTKFSTRNRYIAGSLDPDFYESFEFPCQIPGASEIRVECWDWDGIGDDLIGFTSIDIENRWFCKDWRDLKTKPAEWRTLRNATSSHSQGKLLMWIDIIDPTQAKVEPMINIAPAPCENYELRVVVYGCEEVTIKDTLTDMNDLYVTGMLDLPGGGRQKTDIHLRSKYGKGSFNYRMIFPVQLPTRVSPRFTLAIWDMDVLSANDSICETVLNLRPLFLKALKTADRTKLVREGKEKIWIEDLQHPNFKGSQGRLQVSFELLPDHMAKMLPAGKGRKEPNTNPYLPPPEGRMKLSFLDPIGCILEVCGTRIFLKCCCFLFSSILITTLIMCFPTLMKDMVIGWISGDDEE